MKEAEPKMTSRRLTRAVYIAPMFCAFLCLFPLFGSGASPEGSSWWEPAFFSFLPMCFFFSAFATHTLIKQIEVLQDQVQAL